MYYEMKIKSILNLMIVKSKRILLLTFSNKIPIQTSNTASFKTLWLLYDEASYRNK